jgi:hypothetical protein
MEISRRYSDSELQAIFEVGRLHIVAGEIGAGEAIFRGLSEVSADYLPAWLGIAYARYLEGDFEAGLQAARQAIRIEPNSISGLLMLVNGLLCTEDINSAGAFLGEVREQLEVSTPSAEHRKLYKMLLARYQLESVAR